MSFVQKLNKSTTINKMILLQLRLLQKLKIFLVHFILENTFSAWKLVYEKLKVFLMIKNLNRREWRWNLSTFYLQGLSSFFVIWCFNSICLRIYNFSFHLEIVSRDFDASLDMGSFFHVYKNKKLLVKTGGLNTLL